MKLLLAGAGLVLSVGFALMVLMTPARAVGPPPDATASPEAPAASAPACAYGTWPSLEAALTARGMDFVRIDFSHAFGDPFADFKAVVLVHQVGGLAMGLERWDGCLTEPVSVAPEMPAA